MSTRILSDNSLAVMYDSVTDWAFGPVFYDSETHSAEDRIEGFIEWLPEDPRSYSDVAIERKYQEWLKIEPAYWAERDAD